MANQILKNAYCWCKLLQSLADVLCSCNLSELKYPWRKKQEAPWSWPDQRRGCGKKKILIFSLNPVQYNWFNAPWSRTYKDSKISFLYQSRKQETGIFERPELAHSVDRVGLRLYITLATGRRNKVYPAWLVCTFPFLLVNWKRK